MGYMHIENLYKNQNVLLFKELYALEKLHGTSAHIGYLDGKLVNVPEHRVQMGQADLSNVLDTAGAGLLQGPMWAKTRPPEEA